MEVVLHVDDTTPVSILVFATGATCRIGDRGAQIALIRGAYGGESIEDSLASLERLGERIITAVQAVRTTMAD